MGQEAGGAVGARWGPTEDRGQAWSEDLNPCGGCFVHVRWPHTSLEGSGPGWWGPQEVRAGGTVRRSFR